MGQEFYLDWWCS